MEQPIGGYHRPVLLEETLAALDVRPDGTYLDGTAGGGGHAFAVASRLKNGRLIALDQDPDAVEEASARLRGLPATVVRSNFAAMREVLLGLGIGGVDGILLDIGVSSHQLDTPERGFSYHADAPLDMRMSKSGRADRSIPPAPWPNWSKGPFRRRPGGMGIPPAACSRRCASRSMGNSTACRKDWTPHSTA